MRLEKFVRPARPFLFLAISLTAVPQSPAQTLMQSSGPGVPVRVFASDSAILAAHENRKDLPCTVTPIKASLGFDLRFHAGYEVAVPLKDLAGSSDLLTMIFRVAPEGHSDEPVYFSQRVNVPKIDENAPGDAYLQGGFDVGEGKYEVDWLMRDRGERVCAFNWETEAALPPKDKLVKLSIPAFTVDASDQEPFKDEPPVTRDQASGPLNVKVMINFAPQKFSSATLQPLDMNALISILRNISREPRICKFSVVAFNMQEQRVIYRQDQSEQINFPALGDSLNSLSLGTVNLKTLEQKHGDTEFLTNLITKEMANDHPDAMIFAGPKVMIDEAVPQESLKEIGSITYPVFYMNYNLNPQSNPWRDAIGNAVKHLKGYEYTISRPRDLWVAWSEIMARIVRLRVGRSTSPSSSQ